MSEPVQLIPNHRRPQVDAPERHTVLIKPLHSSPRWGRGKKARVPLLLSPVLRALSWAAVVGIGLVLVVYGLGLVRDGWGR